MNVTFPCGCYIRTQISIDKERHTAYGFCPAHDADDVAEMYQALKGEEAQADKLAERLGIER